ncbi:Alpha-ketoglutarate-dependent sulfonate dioxygenase 4 [Colletotrichum sojae]|uniref:Alpha-ketoglutarate-dependent sulfonate dioxygenase 4 n=1 Tax=Colletotrichum sojae TaxID=2175907 RepID=A0A8H6IUG9_9PEZI|nr:Alpha-ketoglutarate-dependent sulfonate dioxygenase 4 [Colletotrichum sojae]
MPSQTEEKNGHIVSYDINLPYAGLTAETAQTTDYPEYMPVWEKVFFDPLPPFPFHDPALRVTDPSLPNLLTPNVSLKHIQPSLGTVVHGLQLSTLSDVQKDELAHLVSHRKILAFPEQDLIDAGPAAQQAFMDHFGKRNYQPISGSVKGFPGFHIIHRDGNREEIRTFLGAKTTTTLWHQDVSYEIQPPGYVMLGLLQGPEVGGDTVFAATDTAYKRLSPAVQAFLDKLDVVHTSARMISHARAAGGLVRKDPVETVHPLVRVHPVTGERCLFLNGEFVTGIVGLKDAEREMLMDFLMRHMVSGHDFQARVSWSPRTIVIFDNRSCLHSAIVDYIDEDFNAQPRHIFRLCAMAEKPIPVERDD